MGRWLVLEGRSLVIIVEEDGCIEVGDRLFVDHCGASRYSTIRGA